MKSRILILTSFLLGCLAASVAAQQPICINGQCYLPPATNTRQPLPFTQPPGYFRQPTLLQQPAPVYSDELHAQLPPGTIILDHLMEEVTLEANEMEAVALASAEDRFALVIQATVRVTTGNVCGSGTVVGRDSAGNALVLTNAHVAGSTRGRTVNLERWNTDGNSERGTGTIIAAGYGRGMSIDFALLKCNSEFAKQVTPIPLADRYPKAESGVTTYGCPRCEWPSLQVLKLNRSEGQILSWKPEAIGGRSGSSIIDYTAAGPRVVGLLTWAGGGEGLGQSTPFILEALRGRLPASIEALPNGVREVGETGADFQETDPVAICRVPASTSGFPLSWPIQEEASSPEEASAQDNQGLIDSILEKDRSKENGILNRNRERSPGAIQGPIARGVGWVKRVIGVLVLCAVSGGIGYFIGRRRN